MLSERMPRLGGFATDATITFDGVAVPARAGESVAAAMLAAGRPLIARSSKYHRPRGPFCLSGSCGNCFVRADGQPNVRSCRASCRDGLAVESQNAIPSARHDLLGAIDLAFPHGLDHHHLATWSAAANRAAVAVSRRLAGLGRLPSPVSPVSPVPPVPGTETYDALVIGSGPAGLGAAEALAAAGRRILLVDAAPAVGGRLRARLGLSGEPPAGWAERVVTAVRAAGGEACTSAAVAGIWRDGGAPLALLAPAAPGIPGAVGAVGAVPGTALRLVRARRIVVCTGAHPQPPTVPGGDRPGVLAARGAAALLAEHGVVPGTRVAVLGSGDEPEAIAARFADAGADPVLLRGEAAAIRGRGQVTGTVLADGTRLACDALLVSGRLAPATELPRLLGAALQLDPATATFGVRAAASGATDVPGVLAAGEVTGAMDAGAAAEAGWRAGEEAAR